MDLKYGFISVDDHVQEHPEVWTQRLSKAKWGDRMPHVERQADGTEHWVVDGQKIDLPGVAVAGAAMPDRAREPQRWEEVPKIAYTPAERLTAMNVDGVDYSILYPIVAGLAGFLTARNIEIAEVASRSYAAAQTGAAMFAVQMMINLPTRLPIAQLREDFMEYCDSQNLDAILEPVKN